MGEQTFVQVAPTRSVQSRNLLPSMRLVVKLETLFCPRSIQLYMYVSAFCTALVTMDFEIHDLTKYIDLELDSASELTF